MGASGSCASPADVIAAGAESGSPTPVPLNARATARLDRSRKPHPGSRRVGRGPRGGNTFLFRDCWIILTSSSLLGREIDTELRSARGSRSELFVLFYRGRAP